MDTKNKILSKARDFYNSKGLNNVTARVICESLNISLGSFSYHFPDKKIIIKSLYGELQKELQNVYLNVKNEEPNILIYLETHKEIFLIQTKYKFFYLNLFEILSNYEEIKTDFSQNASEERTLAKQMLEFYIETGILVKNINQKNIERIINVGQILNNFWIIDAEVSTTRNFELSFYMQICCGLLEPYLESSSRPIYKKYFAELEKST